MENSLKQQRKLIAAVLSDDNSLLSEPDASVSDTERERLFLLMDTGKITDENWNKIIEQIADPKDIRGIDAVYETIIDSKYEERILAYMSGLGFDKFDQNNTKILEDFYKKYPGPAEFDAVKEDFLRTIRENNSEEKAEEYTEAMKEYVRDIYGKRQEYFEQVKVLKSEAKKWSLTQSAKKLGAEYLPKAVIDADPFKQGEKEYALTTEILKEAGLAPRHEIEVGGVVIGLSGMFYVGPRKAVIAYAKTNTDVKVRAYYRSRSQGMWRYFPDYVGEAGNFWFGKGWNEESMTLPMKLQKILNEIAEEPEVEFSGINTEIFLCGTAKRYDTMEEYSEKFKNGELLGDYYREVKREPAANFGVLSSVKHPPEGMDIDGPNGPNFRKELLSFQIETGMYGKVKVSQFPSFDDQLRWTMMENEKDGERRAWIGGVEVNAPITTTGCKAEWVSTGDIGTPLYEHENMAGGYGDAEDRNGQDYVSMWKYYLRQMPIIKRYLYTK